MKRAELLAIAALAGREQVLKKATALDWTATMTTTQTDPNGKLPTYNYKCPKCFKFVFKTGHSSGCPTTL